MIFSSFPFLIFLSVTLAVALMLNRFGNPAVKWFLTLASLFFYGYWKIEYLGLLLFSIFVNYLFYLAIRSREKHFWWLTSGVIFNLGIIGYYKYTDLMISSANWAFETDYPLQHIILPLAISFFTFQQIAFLVDASQGKTEHTGIGDYLLFVTFFPQLIAGPIVHHSEMLPQFRRRAAPMIRGHLAIGITIFAIGLFKKIGIADQFAPIADHVFARADAGIPQGFIESWSGTLAYTLQIYFDFSGYSDMAIGLARMFGIRLPLNFFSPYRATNIVDFWRRWHITLSRFLRDYLYVPLGGNRKGQLRRYGNLMTTMLLGGLWHGAGWNFLIWGGLHGAYLSISHFWHFLRRKVPLVPSIPGPIGWLLTITGVMIAWVFFRAETLVGTQAILEGMAGIHGMGSFRAVSGPVPDADLWLLSLPLGFEKGTDQFHGISVPVLEFFILAAGTIVFTVFAPNTWQLMRKYRPAIDPTGVTCDAVTPLPRIRWRPIPAYAIATAVLLFLSILSMTQISPFLYFQF